MTGGSVEASTLQAQCLALLDRVAETRESVVVTRHGKPVVRLVPVDSGAPDTDSSVTLLAEGDEAYLAIGEAWRAG